MAMIYVATYSLFLEVLNVLFVVEFVSFGRFELQGCMTRRSEG